MKRERFLKIGRGREELDRLLHGTLLRSSIRRDGTPQVQILSFQKSRSTEFGIPWTVDRDPWSSVQSMARSVPDETTELGIIQKSDDGFSVLETAFVIFEDRSIKQKSSQQPPEHDR